MDTFILAVGNTRDRNTHSRCASHNGPVPPGGTVESQCRAIARYLSFKRDGEPDSYVTVLCEVVVIGHRHISKYMQCVHGHLDDVKDKNTYVFTFKSEMLITNNRDTLLTFCCLMCISPQMFTLYRFAYL